MNHTNFSFSSKDGIDLFGRAWISLQATPKGIVYLVHGLGEHSGRYAHVADALNKAGYHLVSFDLRGHGLSKGKRGHSPNYDCLLDDIQIFIKESRQRFAPNLPRFLYGHSLGGNLVINFALQRSPNLNGVIVTAPLLRTAFEPPKVKLLAARIMAKLMPTFTLKNGLETDALSRDRAIVKAYKNDSYVHDLLSARLGLDMLMNGLSALKNASNWTLPLLLMHGTGDRITSHHASQEFAQAAGKSVDLILWKENYHEIHNDLEKKEVISTTQQWLDKRLNG
jgi:alpha-beta hydrolase superfamily lysophospholipase